VPRSAFLEGAREAGGTKTCTGAKAKQKTAAPQGAASLSLAVLESDGRKRKVGTDNFASWSRETRTTGVASNATGSRDPRCESEGRLLSTRTKWLATFRAVVRAPEWLGPVGDWKAITLRGQASDKFGRRELATRSGEFGQKVGRNNTLMA
jgi:hypothetical protein